MAPLVGPAWAQRTLALLLALVVVPSILSVRGFLGDAPIAVGEPSPRTVVAPDLIRVVDEEGTQRSRREAAQSVEPVVRDDNEARQLITQRVADVFAQVREARQPDSSGQPPTSGQQIDSLTQRLDVLDADGIERLVSLNDEQLSRLENETVGIAQQLARRRISADDVANVTQEVLDSELAIRSLPQGTSRSVVAPLIREVARPTLVIDDEATEQRRRAAADGVATREVTYTAGQAIVRSGEEVSQVEMDALRQRGLEGGDPVVLIAKAVLLSLVITAAVSVYLRVYRRHVWESPRRLLLLSVLLVVFSVALEATMIATDLAPWHYVVPVGALAMLATILLDPPIGVLSTVPLTAYVAFVAPGEAGLVAFAATGGLMSVPLVSRLSARGQLRRAAWQSTVAYALMAAVFTTVFSDPGDAGIAAAAGLMSGLFTAMLVNSALPFLESVFGILTATSLLDLQDRNHPMLRELEQKALGSYNHSIEVSKMVERACRRIDADSLLGSVAALYHDIGKVRRPYFFVENQFGIANPHDDLAPEVSARIIKRHVSDGVELARSYRLPPEVVEGIRTHHGTTLVSYFYRQAVKASADGEVDESAYRYPGERPSSKEMAVLMLADCCEGATRAAAMHDRNLTRDTLTDIVNGLIDDRVEDGQLDDADLTFRELAIIREAFIEMLVGTYHPRIPYPDLDSSPGRDDGRDAADGVPTPSAAGMPGGAMTAGATEIQE